jgi:hypothetical protein
MRTLLAGPDVQGKADRIRRERASRGELLDALTTDERSNMTDTATRETLTSTGEHLAGHVAATLAFGKHYSDEEYIRAVNAARRHGAGERYADRVLGADVDALLRGVDEDDGEATCRAAERRLRCRGIDPAKASYEEFRAALVEVSP